ncbi:nuclear transport factor 2 family protein [Amycolatopsis magusensis]|uniref:nuclear transport factor 2 family protein n=1 Tax=Amycolatopsis magusensis TaxID=882444 RepID=UPI0024A9BA55|nr:nuclear transport factor 2 family protein [Amycolatopsis magusensis]MDI5977324.1 nuclear transport factor 2 family protein [Amycolatopsis magusensis]
MTATERYREGGEKADLDLVLSAFAEDAVLISPLTDRVRFTGKAEIAQIVQVALGRIEGMRFHTDVGDERTRTLVCTGRINGVAIEESALARLDDDGLIREMTLFVRPLPALVELMGAFGPDLARAHGRTSAAKALGVLIKPLIGMVRSGDRFGLRLVTPRRR